MSQKQSELVSASTDQALTNSETTQKKAEVIMHSIVNAECGKAIVKSLLDAGVLFKAKQEELRS